MSKTNKIRTLAVGSECRAVHSSMVCLMRARATDRNVVLIGIALEVKRRRQSLELTQIKLATKAGVHTNVIGRLGAGNLQSNPTVLLLGSIAKALNASMVDLLGRTSR